MLITPSGVPYQELTPDDIVFINSKGCFDEYKVPSSEWQLTAGKSSPCSDEFV